MYFTFLKIWYFCDFLVNGFGSLFATRIRFIEADPGCIFMLYINHYLNSTWFSGLPCVGCWISSFSVCSINYSYTTMVISKLFIKVHRAFKKQWWYNRPDSSTKCFVNIKTYLNFDLRFLVWLLIRITSRSCLKQIFFLSIYHTN